MRCRGPESFHLPTAAGKFCTCSLPNPFQATQQQYEYAREILKSSLAPSITNSPLGKHANIVMPYEIIAWYGIGTTEAWK